MLDLNTNSIRTPRRPPGKEAAGKPGPPGSIPTQVLASSVSLLLIRRSRLPGRRPLRTERGRHILSGGSIKPRSQSLAGAEVDLNPPRPISSHASGAVNGVSSTRSTTRSSRRADYRPPCGELTEEFSRQFVSPISREGQVGTSRLPLWITPLWQ